VKIGKFDILSKLSDGPTASVFKAYQPDLDRVVLLKVLHPHLRSEPGLVDRFRREARAGARLDSEFIVHVYDLTEADSFFSIAMEYVEGTSLRQLLEANGRLDPSAAIAVAAGVLKALEYAHSHGVLHRDVKPANILLTLRGGVKLTDFGLASIANASSLTTDGTLLGTPAYMSPEQARGEPVDARSDLFSLGATVYEMLSGEKIFGGSSYAACLHKIQTLEPVPLGEKAIGAPESLSRWMLKLLEKRRERRFTSASEALAALEDMSRTAAAPASASDIASLVAPHSNVRAVGTTGGMPGQETAEYRKEGATESHPLRRRNTWLRFGSIAGVASLIVLIVLVVRPTGDRQSPSETTSVRETAADTPHSEGSSGQKVSPPGTVERKSGQGREHDNRGLTAGQLPVNTAAHPVPQQAGPAPPTSGTGELEIRCIPWARIYVDGEFVETTPLKSPITLSAGVHRLIFRNPSFSDIARQVDVKPGVREELSVDFLENGGFLRVTVRPWAKVYVDDVYRDETPLSSPIVLQGGNHKISLRNPAFKNWEESRTITPGDTLTLNIVLEPSPK